MHSKVHGAVVVVTGASSGIGYAAALAFARHGARLVLTARNEQALLEVLNECKKLGADGIAVPTDVSDAAAVKRLAAEAHAFGRRIDVWVNNAGVGAVGPFEQTPIEAHDQVIRTNLIGYLNGAHATLPYFKRQQSGILINTNSLGGWVPAPYAVSYTASKFGLRGFSEALRGELSPWPNIHICDIYPAFIDTPGLRHAASYIGKEISPLPPLYDPHQVARAMIQLAQSPRDSVAVGQFGVVARFAYSLFPVQVRTGLARLSRRYFSSARSVPISDGNLFQPPGDEPRILGNWRQPSARTITLLGAGLAAGVFLALTARSSNLPTKRVALTQP